VRLREPGIDAEKKSAVPKNLFIIFVDAKFTNLFARLFTNVFDVIAQTAAIPCLYLACTTD
jgi:hypothetical protein